MERNHEEVSREAPKGVQARGKLDKNIDVSIDEVEIAYME